MSDYKSQKTTATFNLKSVVDASTRTELNEINARTNEALVNASKHMFKLGLVSSAKLACMAMPITSQWMLCHMITNKLIDSTFNKLSDHIDSIVPKQSDEKISDYLLKARENPAGDSLFADEKLPSAISEVMKDVPFLDLSSNQMHSALKALSEQTQITRSSIHSESIFKTMMASQFNAAVKNANFDVFTNPIEANREKEEAVVRATFMRGEG